MHTWEGQKNSVKDKTSEKDRDSFKIHEGYQERKTETCEEDSDRRKIFDVDIVYVWLSTFI